MFYNVKQIIPLCSSSLCKYFSKRNCAGTPCANLVSCHSQTLPSTQTPSRWAAPSCAGRLLPRSFPTPPSPAMPPLRILSTPGSPLFLGPPLRTLKPGLPTSTLGPASAHLQDPPQGPPCPDPALQGSGSSLYFSTLLRLHPLPPRESSLPEDRPWGWGVDARLADSPAVAREPPAHSCGTLEGLAARAAASPSAASTRVSAGAPRAAHTPRSLFLRHPAPASRPQPGCRSGPLRLLQGLRARRASAPHPQRPANRRPQPASESRLYPRPSPPPPKPTNGKSGPGAGLAVA